MARNENTKRRAGSPRVMRAGKTRRDHDSGAWANHLRNKQMRRLASRLAA
jgi:hypothetical protein